MKLSFSEFSIDSETLELHIDGNCVAIDERNITLLLILAQSYPSHCSKQDCLDKIWQETVVSDMSLSKLVSDTRKLFHKAGYYGPLIQTVHGRGYRLEHVLGKQVVQQAQLARETQLHLQLHEQGSDETVQEAAQETGAEPVTNEQPASVFHGKHQSSSSRQTPLWELFAKGVIALLLLIGLIIQFQHVTNPSHEHTADADHQHTDSAGHDKETVRQLAYSEPNGAIARVLWVDDHPENNLVEKAYLEQINIGVYNTVTSEEALMLLTMYNYQAVISDMGRHGDSLAGLKLLQAMRAAGNRTAFYLYTYVESPGVVDAIYESGGQAVVLDSETLYKLVLSHIEQESM
ncbi:winged helix-turn-helix domain-containing protein [Shewanella sp. 125m-7]